MKITNEEIFCKNSKISQATLRKRYFELKLSDYKCAICGLNEWNGKKLGLRLDHINGDNHDNRVENLRLICPNCDSQLDTYCWKNYKCKKERQLTLCQICGEEISYGAKYCKDCYKKYKIKKVNNTYILKDEEKKQINKEDFVYSLKYNTWEEIRKEYNISNKKIRKICESFGIPCSKKDLKNFTIEELLIMDDWDDSNTLNTPLSEEDVIKSYLEKENLKEVAQIYNCCTDTIKNICIKNNIPIKQNQTKLYGKKVDQYTLDGNFITTHESMRKACLSIGKPNSSGAISKACKSKSHIAIGYKWYYNDKQL